MYNLSIWKVRYQESSYFDTENRFFFYQGLFLKGETDWKVIAIDVNDPLAENLNDIHDVEKLMPGFLKVTFYPVDVLPVSSWPFIQLTSHLVDLLSSWPSRSVVDPGQSPRDSALILVGWIRILAGKNSLQKKWEMHCVEVLDVEVLDGGFSWTSSMDKWTFENLWIYNCWSSNPWIRILIDLKCWIYVVDGLLEPGPR